MTDAQLYISVGIPSMVALVGILVNVSFFVTLSARITSLDTRMDTRIDRLDTKFELLIGKVIEVDNRLTRVEEQLKHLR